MARLAIIGMINHMIINLLLIELSEQAMLPWPFIYPSLVPEDATLKIMEGTNFTFQCKIGAAEYVWNAFKRLEITYTWAVKLDKDLDTDMYTPIWKTTFNQQKVTHHAAEDKYNDKVLSARNDIESLRTNSFLSLLNVERNDLLTYDSTEIDLSCSVKYRYNGTKWDTNPSSIVKVRSKHIVIVDESGFSTFRPQQPTLYPLHSPPDIAMSPGLTHTFTVIYNDRKLPYSFVTATWNLVNQTDCWKLAIPSCKEMWVVKYENNVVVEDRAKSMKEMLQGSDNTITSIQQTHSLTFFNIQPSHDMEIVFIVYFIQKKSDDPYLENKMTYPSKLYNIHLVGTGSPNFLTETTSTTTELVPTTVATTAPAPAPTTAPASTTAQPQPQPQPLSQPQPKHPTPTTTTAAKPTSTFTTPAGSSSSEQSTKPSPTNAGQPTRPTPSRPSTLALALAINISTSSQSPKRDFPGGTDGQTSRNTSIAILVVGLVSGVAAVVGLVFAVLMALKRKKALDEERKKSLFKSFSVPEKETATV